MKRIEMGSEFSARSVAMYTTELVSNSISADGVYGAQAKNDAKCLLAELEPLEVINQLVERVNELNQIVEAAAKVVASDGSCASVAALKSAFADACNKPEPAMAVAEPSHKTLKDCIPNGGYIYDYDAAYKYLDCKVIDTRETGWPGKHKNVALWWVLDNGKAVGWNENPATGWSFPVISYPGKAK